jgi:hypothetical protein
MNFLDVQPFVNSLSKNLFLKVYSFGRERQLQRPATEFQPPLEPRAQPHVGFGPNQSAVNMSLFKTFKLTETWNLQFRTEAFNLPNHPVFGNPNTSFGNANFGKITSTAGVYTPRQIQFALKLLF